MRIEGALLASIANSVHKLWWRISLSHLKIVNINKENSTIKNEDASLKGVKAAIFLRDNLMHRRDIKSAYSSATYAAKSEIIIANIYFVSRDVLGKSY